ncbi:hypothetical protein GCM10020331_091500 [Ectobacillus funiculus]
MGRGVPFLGGGSDEFCDCSHAKKFKAVDVKGMQIHNYREKESHTNPDIDKDRTQLNYDLLNDSRIDF